MLTLYDYFRSTASYRVRIALHLKDLDFTKHPIHLINDGGEQHKPAYTAINPQGLVPALETDEHILTQSLAIIEYLDETHPKPPLLPQDPVGKALVRAMALTVACDIHPLNNLRVTQYLRTALEASDSAVTAWYHHWLKKGFDALEAQLEKYASHPGFCYGSEIGLADIFLVPQVYNANRFNFDLQPYPLIRGVNAHCLGIPAFWETQP